MKLRSNYVSIIGYQLEKVHTGAIKWLLNTANPDVLMNKRFEIIRRTYRMIFQSANLDFTEDQIMAITCFPEFSIGRKRKIDLVIKIELVNRQPKYFVIEMKVDSIPYEAQLKGTKDEFLQAVGCDSNDVKFFLYLLGTSQVCQVPDNLHSFNVFALPEILEIYRGLHIDHYIYNDWISELENEQAKLYDVVDDFHQAISIKDHSYWYEKGYRGWQHYYYLYHHMKPCSMYKNHWSIYSGGNNPVMNYWGNNQDGWIPKKILGYDVKFYWEFNYEEFVLKVLLNENNKLPQGDLNWLRDEIATLCDFETNKSGRKTQNRYGTYNSIYKWKFDFKNQDFTHIMKQVDEILDKVHPKIVLL
ncbi:hypothetical protein H7K32_26940 [Brevibacillus agri]|uniref:PD-(D/E)XK nuclease family protein n=1 Tax=Brevibacillus agri TaxID=51101 RepID=UPI001C8D885D|nr:PD-(D/E)XK nuclease family protein [Brevibacillus agri]MBY0055181.1 hypothetical protein [Brevibacillus agri]